MNPYEAVLEKQLSLWATVGSVITEQVVENGVAQVKITITYQDKNVVGVGADRAQAIFLVLHKARNAFLD